VNELPSGAAIAPPLAAHSLTQCPGALKRPSFLMSMWISFARPLAPVTARRFGWLEGAQPIEARAVEHAADGGRRGASLGGDRRAGQPLATQHLNAVDGGLCRRLAQPVRPRAAQAGQAFHLEAFDWENWLPANEAQMASVMAFWEYLALPIGSVRPGH
jgi:hypothetical protein